MGRAEQSRGVMLLPSVLLEGLSSDLERRMKSLILGEERAGEYRASAGVGGRMWRPWGQSGPTATFP